MHGSTGLPSNAGDKQVRDNVGTALRRVARKKSSISISLLRAVNNIDDSHFIGGFESERRVRVMYQI